MFMFKNIDSIFLVLKKKSQLKFPQVATRYIVCDDPIEFQRKLKFQHIKVKHAHRSFTITLGSYEAFNDMSNT